MQGINWKRCPAEPPKELLKGRHDDPYGCDYSAGHEGSHAGHALGYSWRQSNELNLTIVWE